MKWKELTARIERIVSVHEANHFIVRFTPILGLRTALDATAGPGGFCGRQCKPTSPRIAAANLG
jgi:hypothetical protein